MALTLFLIQLMRGSGEDPSLIGATRCVPLDWVLYSLIITIGLVMTLGAVWLTRREYMYKKKIAYTFAVGDFKCTTTNAIKLPIYAMICGFLSAATGTGPGSFFNPLLL